MSGRIEKNILSQYKPPEGSNEQNSSRHEAHRKRKQKEEEITPVRLTRKRKETEVTSSVDRKRNREGDMATSGEWKVTSVDSKINLKEDEVTSVGRKRKWKEEKDKEKRKHPGGESDVEYESSSAQGNGCQMIETYGNLFKAPMNHSLAHCVAADMRMGSGIAVNFRKRKQKEEEITPVRLTRKRKETEVTSSVDRKRNREGDMATSGEWKVTSVDSKINLKEDEVTSVGRKRKWKEEKDKEKRKHPGGESDVEYESSSAQGNGCQMIETYGNLFKAPMNHSLAHCVAADMRMGSGIAVNFRQKLGHVGELLDQLAGVGDVAILKIDERFIYYLVTKEFSNGKPKMADLISSLKKMREHCERKRIKYVSIPKLGCGLDRLYWNEVKTAIYKVFTDLDIKIIVHDFNPPKSYYFKQNAVYIERDNDVLLTTIASKEVVLLLGTKDNCFISSSSVNLLKQLDKYRYYMQANKKMGQIVQISGVRPIFGLIVKETYRDMFSYKNFENCLLELRTEVEEGHIKRIALEEFGNRMTMEKVITVIKHVFEFTGIKVIICKNWQRKQYYRYPNQMRWQYPQVHPYRYQSTK